LNDLNLNLNLLYFPEENPKQLDQDEIIEILDQAKAPDRHDAMVNANIEIFEMSYEESVFYFKRLENLEKIRRTKGPNSSSLPVDNKKRVFVTIGVGKPSKNHKGPNMRCHNCDKYNHNRADCRAIAKLRKMTFFESKSGPRMKCLVMFFLFKEINALKRQLKPEMIANSKKGKSQYLLSTEVDESN
jgi:hypothetical protein